MKKIFNFVVHWEYVVSLWAIFEHRHTHTFTHQEHTSGRNVLQQIRMQTIGNHCIAEQKRLEHYTICHMF